MIAVTAMGIFENVEKAFECISRQDEVKIYLPVSYTHQMCIRDSSLTAFIPKDIVITVLAVLIAIPIRKGINNAGNR